MKLVSEGLELQINQLSIQGSVSIF